MLYLLTGNGKGKTTSAIGMGVRTVGAGKKVLMIQFLKSGNSSEIGVLKKLDNFFIFSFGGEEFIPLQKNNSPKTKMLLEREREAAQKGMELFKKWIKEGRADFYILDEVNLAIKFGLIKEKELLSFLKKYKKNFHIVLTGRNAPEKFYKICDLVSVIKGKKHPYRQGIKAEKGIEF